MRFRHYEGGEAAPWVRWAWVAWSMLSIYVLAWAIAIRLMVANGIPEQEEPGFIVALWVAFTAFMVVGAVIVAHRHRNAIGWIFSAIGLLAATGILAMEYAAYASMTHLGSLPGAILAAGTTGEVRRRSARRRDPSRDLSSPDAA